MYDPSAVFYMEKLITGPEAGITRDSISLDWQWVGADGTTHAVQLVDTAGLRKRAKVDDKLEKLSAWDTKRAIDHAEVVVVLVAAVRRVCGIGAGHDFAILFKKAGVAGDCHV